MSCLMGALQDTQVRLQPECKRRLQDRIDMWSYAAKVSAHKHKRHPGGQILHLYCITAQPLVVKDALFTFKLLY